MRNMNFFWRILMILSFVSINSFAAVLNTDTFTSGLDGWSGSGVAQYTSGSTKRMQIDSQAVASKTYTYAAESNNSFTLTFDVTKVTTWESNDTVIITLNGVTVYNANPGSSITLRGSFNSSGSVSVTIQANTDATAEKLQIDNVVLSQNATYTSSNERPFTLQYMVNEIGDMVLFGNTILCKSSIQSSSYKNGTCNQPGVSDSNDNIWTLYTKLSGDGADSTIFNSSSSNLTIPTGSTVLWATLYWQGGINSDSIDTATGDSSLTDMTKAMEKARTVKLKVPGASSYVTVRSDGAKFNWNRSSSTYNYYQGAADITSLVQQSGTYQVANLVTNDGDSDGGTGPYGGWSMMVVYKDIASGASKLKNMVVYDGYKLVTDDVTQTFSGFYTPISGTVNAKFTMFAAEADVTRTDAITMTQTSSTGTAVAVATNELNSSIMDSNGTSVTTRSPNYGNTIGIDIHTWNVGNGTGAKNIIGNSQSSTTVVFDYPGGFNADIYNLGAFSFATDLYQPQVCYIENIFKGTTNISGIGAQVNEDDNLTVRVYVKNTGNDNAEKVQILHQFDSSFPYEVNSANYNNSNPAYETLMPPSYTRTTASDSSGNDLYEYNTTSLMSKINLGSAATSGSGGLFYPTSSGTPTYAVYEYSATVKVLDSNYSNIYKAAYKNSALGIDYSNNPVTMQTCDGSKNSFWGYRAIQTVVGDFNVVYADHQNGTLSSGYYYNLPTQITSRADNYKVISLDGNTLKDINTTVAVELVDADSSANCSTMTRISGLKTWVSLYNTNKADLYAQDVIDGMILYDADAAKKFYQKAGKNVKFRISYPVDGTGGNIIMNETVPGKYHLNNFPSYAGSTCVYPVTATTYNPANGNPQGEHTYTQVPEACGNAGQSGASAMTQHEVNVCLECIYGTSVNYACSKDNFAIRPEGFFVKLNDQNQTNSASKQFMMNNTPSPANKNMASGYRYYMEVNATNHLGDASSLDYNTTENVDFVWNSAQTGCNDDTNKSISFSFANGLADGNVSVNQVGEYRLSIIDTAWAAVDSNTSLMTHHTGSYFMGGTDCTADSAVSSAVKTSGIGSSAVLNGCNISTNHTNSVAGVTYTDSDVTFHPYKFDMSTINFGVGLQPQEINATSGPDFVYMSDMSRTDSMNMSVRATGTISARGENNATLSNFVDNCYAVNTNLSMNTYNNITLANTDYQVRFIDTNGSGTLYDSNATNVATGALAIPLMTLNDGNFTKDMSGSLNSVTRLNYDRNQTTPLNPMTVQYGTLGFKCVTTSECTMQADLSGSHEAVGSKVMDFNVTHIYGRIIPRDVRVFGNVPFVANAWYEGYNLPTLNGISLEASKNDALWYVNNVHIDANDGDGNVTVIIPTTPLALPTHSSSTTGMETYQFSAIPLADIPYGGKAHINTDPWLWYGINALNYADPVNSSNLDCLTHPCFNITVVPSIGATGSAKSTNEATKASKKSDSEVGASGWKSTSDYAPAIR